MLRINWHFEEMVGMASSFRGHPVAQLVPDSLAEDPQIDLVRVDTGKLFSARTQRKTSSVRLKV
jgi:hypothetical protein